METAKRNDPVSRGKIADVMLTLSRPGNRIRPYTIASASQILRREIDIALQSRFGLEPTFYPPIFGEGAGHAFGRRELCYSVPEAVPMDPAAKRRFETGANRLMEAALLAGPRDARYIAPEHAPIYEGFNTNFLERERELIKRFGELRVDPQLKLGWLRAGCILDILDEINNGLSRAGVRAYEFAHDAEELTSFLLDLPSRHVDYELQRLRYQNPNLKRGSGDLNDLAALSISVPYCDIVVTENVWVDLIRRSKADIQYGTVMLARLEELPGALADLSRN
jgi:hypothetical protein